MVLIGLLVVLLAAGAGVLLYFGAESLTSTSTLEAAGLQATLTPLQLLITGAVVLLVLVLGLGMVRASVKRRRRPAREAKEAQRQAELEEQIRSDERGRAEETHAAALEERDRLHDEDLQTRLEERDQLHRDELQAKLDEHDRLRDEEFRTRKVEDEERVRAQERAAVEREHAARDTAPVAGVVGGAAAAHADDHSPAAAVDTHDAAATVADASDRGADEPAEAVDPASGDQGPADRGTDLDDGRTSGPEYQTVADKIMGRDPEAKTHPAHRTVADKLTGRHPDQQS